MTVCPTIFVDKLPDESIVKRISGFAGIAGVALSIIGAVGAALVLISPALPPIAAILLIVIPPVYIIHTGFFALMFVVLPKLIAGAVFTAAFMTPFGIAAAAVIGTGLLVTGAALLVHHCTKRPAEQNASISA